jgi:hypothetical protein
MQRLLGNIFGLDKRVDELPEDLRPSVGEGDLVKLVLAAAQTVAKQKPWLNSLGAAQSSPQMLLTLLTYCYPAGIYGSRDIEWACHNNPVVRSICANIPPNWSAIWRFRNANRPWIEECLAFVYVAARDLVPTGVNRDLSHVMEIQRESHPDINRLAQRRLRRAVWTDAATYD